jgi:hypothetical protein
MARSNTILYLALAGGVGYGIYRYFKGQHTYDVAKVIAQAPVPQPGLLETIFGSAQSYFEKARLLDTEIKARGEKHYKAWKDAVKAGRTSYKVDGVLFDTATGQTGAAVLEGYFST